MKNIFVIGLEPFNLALLKSVPGAEAYNFVDLLHYGEVVRPSSKTLDFNALLATAEERLVKFEGSVDGIIAYWDFPSSVIAPVLRRRHGLPGPSLEAVAACEHKYWSRLEQRRVVPDMVPRFCAVDPFADDPLSQIDLSYPFWIKPIKAHSSYLGFKVRSAEDFRACLSVIRANIGHFGEPFNAFLALVKRPDDVRAVDGVYCIAEEIVSRGRQCTLEGYVWQGDVIVYGVVDSIRSGKHRSCFSRYQYPSQLPRRIQLRMIDAAGRFLRHIGYDGAPFNMEFYWDAETDRISLLEVNTRISKSHCPLFKMVDGASHHKVAIDLALRKRPVFPRRQGEFRVAAKFMERVFEDAVVSRLPHDDDLRRLQQKLPGTLIRVMAHEGDRLSHLLYQDSYSFEIAEIFLGAENQAALLKKYRAALDLLPFGFAPLEPAAA